MSDTTPLTKEEMEIRIRKHVKAAQQMDYNGMDELEEVFNIEEVVENVIVEMEQYAKQQAIAFKNWCQTSYPSVMERRLEDQLYNLFIQSTK
jgi:tRNA A37 N6-isopentenylltransferase MiaA